MADFPMIEVLGVNGESLLRYLRLEDNHYYGGTTHDEARKLFPFAYGPHVWLFTGGMLDLIAKIANLPGNPRVAFQLQGSGSGRYSSTPICREMRADVIADILGCPEETVREHYDRLVLVPEAVSG